VLVSLDESVLRAVADVFATATELGEEPDERGQLGEVERVEVVIGHCRAPVLSAAASGP